MKPSLFVQLGRAGDILNILPLCKWEFDRTGQKPWLMVSTPYLQILEGVSYVNPIQFSGAFEDITTALMIAEKMAADMSLNLVCTQIYGHGLFSNPTCTSFLRESWERYPGAPAWGTLPLVFDQRDLDREKEVTAQLLRGDTRPYIVLALSGTSSPFEHAAQLKSAMKDMLGAELNIVDISGYMAPRFYDLLGLLEGARSIVSVDSGVLHLAAATRTPVVAFITREPSRWHGSAHRKNHAARFYYDEAPACFDYAVCVAQLPHRYQSRIVHTWAHFGPVDDGTRRRIAFAKETWRAEGENGAWGPVEFLPGNAQRDSSSVGDDRSVPFFHDMIDYADQFAGADHDIIAYTNADVCFCPGITGRIIDTVSRHGAAFTHRYDFYKPLDRPLRSEAEVSRGRWYPGSDAFFFTVGWWRENRHLFPDMVIGREHVDEVLRQLVKRTGGLEIPFAIYHEKHPSYWEHFGNRDTNPGNLHNRRLARKWFLKTGYGPNDPEWWRIPCPL